MLLELYLKASKACSGTPERGEISVLSINRDDLRGVQTGTLYSQPKEARWTFLLVPPKSVGVLSSKDTCAYMDPFYRQSPAVHTGRMVRFQLFST